MSVDQPSSVSLSFLAVGGEMTERILNHDWVSTALGPLDDWPQSLRTAVDIMLASPGPASVIWGRARVQLYNDAYVGIAGERHPEALGRSAAENWSEAYEAYLGPILDRVYAGETVSVSEHAVALRSPNGGFENRYFIGSFQPVRDEAGDVGGVFHPLVEVSARVRADAGLREREARLRHVLDGMTEGFGLLAPDFTILEHNVEALRLDGRPRDQIVGRSHWEAYPGSEDSELGRLYKRAVAERAPVSLEHRYAFENGRARWLDMRAYPTADGALAVFWRDVTDRKEAEERLRESEGRLTRALEAGELGAWELDLETLDAWRSPQHDRIFGYETTLPEWTYAMFLQHVLPEDRERVNTAFQAAITGGGKWDFECRIRRADGAKRWIWAQGRVDPGSDGRPGRVKGTVRDITDRRTVEERLRELNETLEAQVTARSAERDRLWNLSQDMLARADYDGMMSAVSPAWTQVLGWSQAELLSRGYGTFMHPDDAAPTLEALARMGETGRPARFENRIATKDGGFKPIEWTVTPEADGANFVAVGRDLTAAKAREAEVAKAEAARREADALYRAYFENTAEALFVINVLEDGGFTVEDLNPAHQASVGLPLADAKGKRIDEILPPELASVVTQHYRRVIASGEIGQYRETFQLHGVPTHWDTVLVPVRDREGRIVRLIGSSRDLTAQLAAEEQLRQSQKLEAMGQLTGGVAHDFNNLLTPIIGSLDMLMRRGVGSERERRLIDGALQSAERAKMLVQRLLAFARRQPLQPSAVDLRTVVENMAGLIGSTLGPQIEVRVELGSDLPPVTADQNQLEMALLNLAVNARDAMPQGGTLTIHGRRESVRGAHPANLRRGDYVVLSVADTGVGMDQATVARAVEPFFSTKGIGKGTGLGLSMVHGLVAQLGGGLTIDSTLGRGTTIELWLPVSVAPVEADDTPPEASDARRGRGLALLVDDEDLVRMSTADMLADLGFEVVEAGSGEDALRLVEDGPSPDLLVTDHLMPGMSGVDLARKLRQAQPDLPVLIVSGYAEAEGIGPDLPRLTKPFRNAELAVSLSALVPSAP